MRHIVHKYHLQWLSLSFVLSPCVSEDLVCANNRGTRRNLMRNHRIGADFGAVSNRHISDNLGSRSQQDPFAYFGCS